MSRRGRFLSLKWKLFGWVTGCIVLVLAAVLLLNTFALKPYYVGQKKAQVSRAFDKINTVCEDAPALRAALLSLQDNGAVTAVVWSGRQLLFATLDADRFLVPTVPYYSPGHYDLSVVEADSLMAGDSAREQAIRLVGMLDNGWQIYLRTPVAAIEESIAITNRFLLLTGSGALLLSLLLVFLVARQYSTPVRQLARVADKVARLDFSGRYTGQEKDEIGDLGRSINAMSGALEQTIGQLTEDIRQKEEQDLARRAFIANVSHELKTPIALIGTYAEGLRENIAAGDEERAYYCHVIEDEAMRMSQLLRRMTVLMQLEGGGNPIEPEVFDVTELLHNLMEKHRPDFTDKQVELTIPSMPTMVMADPYLIENVLQNYLSNAAHHVTSGGRVVGQVEKTEDGRVRIGLFNTGRPLPPEELERIWQSFYKVDKARTRAYGGSGIGLSVVAAIMKAHGMPYGVCNREDGVEFFVFLPAAEN